MINALPDPSASGSLGAEDGRGGAVLFWFLHSKNRVSSGFQTGNLRLSGAESPGQGRDWGYLCSVVRACALVQNLVPKVGRGEAEQGPHSFQKSGPHRARRPSHESGSASPSVSAASWSWGGEHGPPRASEDPWEGQEGRCGCCGKEVVWGSHEEARSVLRGRQRG